MIAFDDAGYGPPLVLVHGLATRRLIWKRVMPLLARSRRVIALDVPGFGDSPPAGPGFDLDEVADEVAAGIAPFADTTDVVGHSMGGAVALRLATRQPGLVRRLVLVAPAGLHPVGPRTARATGLVCGGLVALRRRAAPIAAQRLGRRLLLAFGVEDPDAIDASDVRAMARASAGATRVRAAMAAVAQTDLRTDLVMASAPIGAIWGEKDRIVPPAGLGTLLGARPEAAVAVVPHAGHIPMMERPEEFTRALGDVLLRLRSS